MSFLPVQNLGYVCHTLVFPKSKIILNSDCVKGMTDSRACLISEISFNFGWGFNLLQGDRNF
jgi:hypothetical protein